MTATYTQSLTWYDRAQESIPLATQTFSKSRMALPFGGAPLFLKSGKGAQVIDLDGNTYTDFINGLLCVSLGYQDQEVDTAITSQLASGITFSLPHQLEAQVAEQLIELIPCAEMVRFAKNGSDVTSAAVRLARAYTGKEHIAVCGYHGWQDWYIGSTSRSLGVPEQVKQLTHAFQYNDIESLEVLVAKLPNQIAAIVMEPVNISPPKDNFLEKVRALCDKHGIVLVFDEIITGFRYHLGGAQSFFGVTPDLATFGKGMANGMPLSAIVGKKDIMLLMNDIFFSGTFGGEALSLAAAQATINKMKQVSYCDKIWQLGEYLKEQFVLHCGKYPTFKLQGLPPWSFLQIAPSENISANIVKSWLIESLCQRGILFIGSHNLSFAHSKKDIDTLITCYAELFEIAANFNSNEEFLSHMQGQEIESVFKVR